MRLLDPRTGKAVVAFDVDENLIVGEDSLEWIIRTGEAENCLVIRNLPVGTTPDEVADFLMRGADGQR